MQPNPKKVNTEDAQPRMLQGVEVAYRAVSSTLGPRSRNVAIKRPFGAPAVIHDGVKVFRSIFPLPDEEMDTGAQIAYEAAEKTNNVGDGTTTATVLVRNIAREAYKNVTAGARPMALREGIEAATNAVLLELDKLVVPIEATGKKEGEVSQELFMVAHVSAQVEDIGRMVAEAYNELGEDAILTVEESGRPDSYLELKQGMQFDRGWVNPWFITKGNTLREAIIEGARIVVTDQYIRDIEEFVAMMVAIVDPTKDAEGKETEAGLRNIVIIADGFDPDVISFFLKNHNEGMYRGLLINAPSYGEKRSDMLKDIAILTDAQFISESTGLSLRSITKKSLGFAKRVTSTKDTTLIVEGAATKEVIDARVTEIKSELSNGDLAAFDREKLQERLARLHSGIGVIRIGARSESEVKERIERAIDAKSAARAAVDGGIVPGGGMALKTAALKASVELMADANDHDQDWRFGARIVLAACEAPYIKLMENSGYDPGEYKSLVAAKQKPNGPIMGVDVLDGHIVDMIKEGIIDPLLVVKAALGNASSAAVALFTSDTVITEIPRDDRS